MYYRRLDKFLQSRTGVITVLFKKNRMREESEKLRVKTA